MDILEHEHRRLVPARREKPVEDEVSDSHAFALQFDAGEIAPDEELRRGELFYLAL